MILCLISVSWRHDFESRELINFRRLTDSEYYLCVQSYIISQKYQRYILFYPFAALENLITAENVHVAEVQTTCSTNYYNTSHLSIQRVASTVSWYDFVVSWHDTVILHHEITILWLDTIIFYAERKIWIIYSI